MIAQATSLRSSAHSMALRAWRVLTSPAATLSILLLLLAVMGGALGLGVQPATGQGPVLHAPWVKVNGSGLGAPSFWMVPTYLIEHGLFRAFSIILAGLSVLWLLRLWLPSWMTPPAGRDALRRLELDAPEEGVARAVAWAVGISGQRVVRRCREDGADVVVARRTGIAGWLPGLLYVGLLLLMLGSLVGWRYGWRSRPLNLSLGESQPLGVANDLDLRLEQIELHPHRDGRPARARSLLSVYQDGQASAQIELEAGRRASYRGLTLYQLGLGPVARLSATHVEGGALSLQSVFGEALAQGMRRVRLSGSQQEHLLAIVGHDLIVRLVHYPEAREDASPNGTLHLQLLKGSDGSLVEERFLEESGEIAAGPVTVHVALEYYVSVRAEREPHLPLLYAGWGAVFLGLLAYLVWPPRELWVRVCAGRTEGAHEVVTSARGSRKAWYQAFLDLVAEAADA